MFALLCLAANASAIEGPPGTALWTAGEGGYHTYRIPSLLTTADGTLLAFCEGRKNSRDDSGDIDLLVKRSEDGGQTWSKSAVVWDDAENTCDNPCPVQDQQTGRIHLLMNWNHGADSGPRLHDGTAKDTRRVFVTTSDDDGRTWSPPREITEAVKPQDWCWYAVGPGVGIQIRHGEHRGRLVIPCDHTTQKDSKSSYHWGAHAIFSDDGGKTWQRGRGVSQPCPNECQLVELADGQGTLLMNARNMNRAEKTRLCSRSTDGGDTWSAPELAAELPEPVCQGSLIRYSWPKKEQSRLLFCNPADRASRKNLTVRVSLDEGKTWPLTKQIYAGPAAYSCLARLPNGRIGVLFEGGVEHSSEGLYFATMGIDELMETGTKN